MTAPAKPDEFASAEFASVVSFCLFLGSGRSGHSLLGSLLDAHREMIVAHQLDALGQIDAGCERLQLYQQLLENSRRNARQGRKETGYSYEVPANGRDGSRHCA